MKLIWQNKKLRRALRVEVLVGLVLAVCASGSILFAQNSQNKREEVLASFNLQKNIVYKKVDGRELSLLLFLPEGEFNVQGKKAPVMLFTHGGGWSGGDVYKILRPAFMGTLRQLLEEGVACAAVTYRRTRKPGITAFDCVVDCKDAARFLVKNGESYGLDSTRMGLWGGSAGGHLSLMTGLADNDLFPGDESLAEYEPQFRCIASYYPLTSFVREDLLEGSHFGEPEKMIPMLGGLTKDKPELARLLSPVEHVTADSPPMLLLHGARDQILPISQSQHFVAVAEGKGADVRLIAVKGAAHSFGGKKISPSIEEINQMAAKFILKSLKEER